ncbi:HupE/UreJ family protein [Sphingomonas sp. CL5.1]|uniref:HupE/UreJ family protein n=1 Tax=Sphingomonas sp. CL5.1 TaxID=2653203 RepID=UPI001583F288|nr:HupE/UreJ family protein [Sphingomonas sp. CL5.1]QKS01184.1 HupE/UreJ family protein [Sphingomonas sp. CL5.1]
MRRLLQLLLIAFLAGLPSAGLAHTRSESHSNWLVDGSSVHLTFSVSDVEARRLTPDHRPPNDPALVAYLLPRVGASAAGKQCPLANKPKPVAAATGYRRVEFLYNCPTSNGIVLSSNAFYDVVPTHVNLAEVQSASGDFAEYVLNSDDHTIDMDESRGKVAGAGFLTFVEMGIMHIFTGVDHMSFLLGLVLISKRFKDLAFVITGFTLGHSLTLALAVTGVIRPHAEFIDALVALTIALIGIENISVVTHRPGLLALSTAAPLLAMAAFRVAGFGLLPPLLLLGAGLFASNYLMVSGHVRDAARLRLVVTLVFGLIHGFGFAADLLSEPIPTAQLAKLLAGFNIGVEIGQLSVVTLLTLTVMALRRFHLTLPRRLTVDLCAAFLISIGTYWFVKRSFIF